MRAGPAIMLSVAFVCAGLAAILVRNMLSSSNDQAAPTPVAVPEIIERTYIVAAKDLRPGQKLTQDTVREVKTSNPLLPKGAYLSKDALFKAGEDHILSVAVVENEAILPSKFTGEVNPDGFIEKPREGMTPFKIRLNESGAVGAVVQPGDWVDILVTQTEHVSEGNIGANTSIESLLEHVRVLATDQTKKSNSQTPQSITVEVSPEDARVLTLAPNIGQLSVVLSRNSKDPNSSGTLKVKDILHKSKKAENADKKEQTIRVFRSIELQYLNVPSEAKKQQQQQQKQ